MDITGSSGESSERKQNAVMNIKVKDASGEVSDRNEEDVIGHWMREKILVKKWQRT